MRQFTSDELRKAWKQFYIDRGHVDVGAVSLVSDGSTGVMFNVAGMQPLMPYLLGQKHPLGTRLCNVQGCVRTNDIDSVGDKSHVTFFEMMGSWSLGDYFKKERCQWSFELLTQVFGFDADHLAATVFAGDENAPRDEEGAHYRIASGFKKENVYYLPADDNWWGLDGKLKQHEKWGFTNVIDNAGKMDAAQSYHNNQCPTDPYMNYLSKNHWADYHSQNLLHRKNSAEFSEIPDSLYCDNWITDNAIEMINHFTPEKPWFLQVNFAGPHDPWDITKAMKKEALLRQVPFPQNYTGDDNIIEIRQNYCEMIENIDKNIGRIVKLLKDKCMFENTIIIYSSDHGEMLGDFSMFGKNRPYRSSTHIPLVISGAAIQNKGITNTPVELQDLAKTFTDFANCATTDVLKNSHSLYPLLTNKPYSPRLCAYSSLKNVNQVGNRTNILGFEMILDNEYKYVEFEDGSQELFHIKSDIWEKHNLNTKCPELTKNYHKLLVKETLK